jgi:hypothetical protein
MSVTCRGLAWIGQTNVPVKHLVDRTIERDRLSRIQRAYDKKLPKLVAWQQLGARAVLVLEEGDVQATNHELVADAVAQVERSASALPDEVWLVSTAVRTFWATWALRVGGHVYEDLSKWGDSLDEIKDPSVLVDVTEPRAPL